MTTFMIGDNEYEYEYFIFIKNIFTNDNTSRFYLLWKEQPIKKMESAWNRGYVFFDSCS